MGFGDWTPLDLKPGTDLPDADLPGDLPRRQTAIAGTRNGMPDVLPYVWRPGEAQRDAELAARLAAIRAVAEQRALARAHGPVCSCPLCIAQYGPITPPPPPPEAPPC